MRVLRGFLSVYNKRRVLVTPILLTANAKRGLRCDMTGTESSTIFPRIAELPSLLSAESWNWERYITPSWPSYEFWVGEDAEGREWLVKMSGSFCAHRERTFAGIAQHLDISCQSSVYLTLPANSEPLRKTPHAKPYQLAIWLIPEHEPGFCNDDCQLASLNKIFTDSKKDNIIALRESSVLHAIDLVRGEMLGYLCDMHEPPGHLFTPDHEFVQIDNELMFTTADENFWECDWLKDCDNEYSEAGLREAIDLCEKVVEISDAQIKKFSMVPTGYDVEMVWDVPQRAFTIREKANFVLELARELIGLREHLT